MQNLGYMYFFNLIDACQKEFVVCELFDCQNPFQAKEELELAKKNYEALNTQLLEEIPGFTKKCMVLIVDCLENFALAQRRLYCETQQDYEELLQVYNYNVTLTNVTSENIVYFPER